MHLVLPTTRQIAVHYSELAYWRRIVQIFFRPRVLEIIGDYKIILPSYVIRENDEIEFMIPNSFLFDGASVPRAAWPILDPTGFLLVPGAFHDFVYRHGFLLNSAGEKVFDNITKKEADEMFRKLALWISGLNVLSEAAFLAVEIFGHKAWNENVRARTGELQLDGPYKRMFITQKTSISSV